MASRLCARPHTRVPHLEGWKEPVQRWGYLCPRVGSGNDPYYSALVGWESARAVSGNGGEVGGRGGLREERQRGWIGVRTERAQARGRRMLVDETGEEEWCRKGCSESRW